MMEVEMKENLPSLGRVEHRTCQPPWERSLVGSSRLGALDCVSSPSLDPLLLKKTYSEGKTIE